ncbi:MAG: cytochrome c [Pyrinomonadaceae bacterium]|nr:cytochrome c [Pyrinomonadaceae bacterium]
MYLNSQEAGVKSRGSVAFGRKAFYGVLLGAYCLLAVGCGVRFDMQDQPRYKTYKKSEFFSDKRGSRDLPAGTVPRGQLKDNKAFYTGQIDNPTTTPVETTTNAAGNTIVTSFPNAVDEFPIPVTKELVDRGQERYNIYCIVCHGPVGNGDGMIVRRGFSIPPTYHDDRLRNAPVGHFFDVISNGWGKMSSYADAIQPADRWAIIAYIRALQVSQNPDQNLKMNNTTTSNPAAPKAAATPDANTHGGGK